MSRAEGWVVLNCAPLTQEDDFLVRCDGEEALSTPFHYRIELASTRELTGKDLLLQPMGIAVRPDDETNEPRRIHGIVRSFRGLGRFTGYWMYEVEIVPWTWFLSLNQDSRIFQEMTVVEIVEKVFQDAGYTDFRKSLTGTYPKLDFTVQFGESDLAFVSRLLEENGIYYFFEHEDGKHTLVLADAAASHKAGVNGPDVVYRTPGEASAALAQINRYTIEESVFTKASVVDDYDYEKPSANLEEEARSPAKESEGATYLFPGGYHEASEGSRLVKVLQEAGEVGKRRLSGTGTFSGIQAGCLIKLDEMRKADENGEYLVVSARMRLSDNTMEQFSEAERIFDVSFEAIPKATPFRTRRRTPRPNLGLQTAVVVGPKGEEIYTDSYGRVKVHFRWDREGKKDEKSSCWIRVASTWAGNKWGAFQVPRIGQEVIVEFLDGDPDRPLITGSVYNAKQMPPWSAAPTQSGWKSHSTKSGGADSNELRFEDKKGEEEIFVRAEKDLTFEVVNDETGTIGNDRTTTIENDDTRTVRHDETTTVENDRAVTVEANETMKVAKNRDRKVSKNEKVSIDGKQTIAVGGNQTVTISKGNRTVQVKMGNLDTKVDLGKITYEAMQSIEFKVGTNSIKIDQMGVTINGMMVKIEAKTMAEFKGLTTKVESQIMTEVKGTMVQVNGQAMLMAKGGITMIG